MCLLKVFENPLKEEEKEGIGYKVFRKSTKGKLFGALFPKKEIVYDKRRWHNERDFRGKDAKNYIELSYSPNKQYKMGFHVYQNKDFALKALSHWYKVQEIVVHKVKYRKAHTKGFQSLDPDSITIVAEEMRILEEVK